MGKKSRRLWCYAVGDNTYFPVIVTDSSTTSIGELKDLIKDKNSNHFRTIDAKDLTLWKVCYF
jgi:Crinkler effector protein N-terminal domain